MLFYRRESTFFGFFPVAKKDRIEYNRGKDAIAHPVPTESGKRAGGLRKWQGFPIR